MPATSSKILIIEDDEELGSQIAAGLGGKGFEAIHLSNGEEGLKRALEDTFDVVLTDYQLPGAGGMDILKHLREAANSVPVVLMTAHGTARVAIEATRNGAFDYLLKPFGMSELVDVLENAIQTARLSRQLVRLGSYKENVEGDFMIGRSPAIQEVFKEIGKLADGDVTVLIRGETGTGKELVARALFQHSRRSENPFIAINCAAIPATLLESELFGHERGAFTGADARRIGRFEQASGGTLFFDEIGEMPSETQAKLLRVLQEKVIRRIGGIEEIPVDTRIVAATNRDLASEISKGNFREDLYYRLNSAEIVLPPLREREDDVLRLVKYFMRHCSEEIGIKEPGLEQGVAEILEQHDWPGNVRQLQNVVRTALLNSRGFAIQKETIEGLLERERSHLSPRIECNSYFQFIDTVLEDCHSSGVGAMELIVPPMEKYAIETAIKLCKGNRTAAAKLLGIGRATMLRKLKQYEIDDGQSDC